MEKKSIFFIIKKMKFYTTLYNKYISFLNLASECDPGNNDITKQLEDVQMKNEIQIYEMLACGMTKNVLELFAPGNEIQFIESKEPFILQFFPIIMTGTPKPSQKESDLYWGLVREMIQVITMIKHLGNSLPAIEEVVGEYIGGKNIIDYISDTDMVKKVLSIVSKTSLLQDIVINAEDIFIGMGIPMNNINNNDNININNNDKDDHINNNNSNNDNDMQDNTSEIGNILKANKKKQHDNRRTKAKPSPFASLVGTLKSLNLTPCDFDQFQSDVDKMAAGENGDLEEILCSMKNMFTSSSSSSSSSFPSNINDIINSFTNMKVDDCV